MANKPLRSIQFPGLTDTYTVPVVDNTLAVTGAAADAKKVGDELTDIKGDISQLQPDPSLSTVSEKPVQNKAIANMFGNIPALSEYGNNVYEILEYLIDAVENPIDPNAIDVCLFAGQSNMDGRGTAADATPVTTGKAFKWDSTNNTVISFEAEGSLIPAYMQEYTRLTKVPLVEVKKAIGGIGIAQYISDYLTLATTMLSNCLTYLASQGKTVRRCFMLWCQGETDVDGDLSTGTTAYENYFATLKSAVMAAGVEQIFIINIGQALNGDYDFSPIRTALQNVCNGTDVVMVSDKYYNAQDYMTGTWHYNQTEYNLVGTNSAENTVAFYNGETPTIRHFESSDIYGVPVEHGTVADWTYELYRAKVLLKEYAGSSGTVRVYQQYLIDGYYYEARVQRSPSSSDNACFTGNTTITSVTFDDGVKLMNPSSYLDTDAQQDMSLMFKDCTNLVTVNVGNDFPDIINCDSMFQRASSLTTYDITPKGSLANAFDGAFAVSAVGNLSGVTSLNYAFRNCTGLTTVGSVSGTYSKAMFAFQNDAALTSVGTIDSTALTNINSIFNNCTHLAGVVRFESSLISSATNAFNNCDLTGITIQCPANSTTYTTLSTAYPDATIVTF